MQTMYEKEKMPSEMKLGQLDKQGVAKSRTGLFPAILWRIQWNNDNTFTVTFSLFIPVFSCFVKDNSVRLNVQWVADHKFHWLSVSSHNTYVVFGTFRYFYVVIQDRSFTKR